MGQFFEMWLLAAITFLACPVLSASRDRAATGSLASTSPPAGAIVVDKSGSSSHLRTVQAGVDALSKTSTESQTLFIMPGKYVEQVYIPPLKSHLTVQGYTTDPTSYQQNRVDITYDLSQNDVSSDDLTATVRQWNPNTKFYNINIHNTFGHTAQKGQALAISANTGNQSYYGVQFTGYQDTVLADTGAQLYAKCLITGAVDFIFTQSALAWFDGVDIRTVGKGCITASGRDSASNPSWIVINKGTVKGVNSSMPAGSSCLGRPWENYARVVYQLDKPNAWTILTNQPMQGVALSNVIRPEGWTVWSSSKANTEHVMFGEYANTGPGAAEAGTRAEFSKQLSKPVAIETVLGRDYASQWWVDTSYLSS